MNNKKATPSTGAASVITAENTIRLISKNKARKLYVAACLLLEGPQSTKELLSKARVTNAADPIYKLRKRGCEILRKDVVSIDKYGAPETYSIYSLTDADKVLINMLLGGE